MNVLVVEDEPRIASFLTKGLSDHGYRVTWIDRGEDVFARIADTQLVLLDLGLPDIDGLDVLRRLRRAGDRTQVLVLTARAEVADVVTGLNLGADDYLVKPFAFDELLARVRARERTQPASAGRSTTLRCGDVSMDLVERTVQIAGNAVRLTEREFDLLRAFIDAQGEVLTRSQLLEAVWGLGFDPGTNIVEVYVGYLRKRLGPERIRTVRGRGYRLSLSPAD
jgi:two-component system, OmpR family, response regulator